MKQLCAFLSKHSCKLKTKTLCFPLPLNFSNLSSEAFNLFFFGGDLSAQKLLHG